MKGKYESKIDMSEVTGTKDLKNGTNQNYRLRSNNNSAKQQFTESEGLIGRIIPFVTVVRVI